MATFKKDTTKVQSFSAGPIKHTGFYACTITKCYDKKAQDPNSQSSALHFDFVTDAGQYGSFDLWWKGRNGLSTDKNDKDLPALQSINDLQILLEHEELNSKPGKVMIYDFDLKQEVETKKMVYADVINKRIGIIFEAKEQPKNKLVNGEWIATDEIRTVLEFRQFFDADTQASANEFLSGKYPVSCESYLKTLMTSNNNQAPVKQDTHVVDTVKPSNDVIDDFDDSLPF